jgi:hypothetical protein
MGPRRYDRGDRAIPLVSREYRERQRFIVKRGIPELNGSSGIREGEGEGIDFSVRC